MSGSVPLRRGPSRARRCLFGRPDPIKVDQWLGEELDKLNIESKAKWNYDFVKDKPVEGDVIYEAIKADEVPSVYRARTVVKRKSHIAELDPNVPSGSSWKEKESDPSYSPPVLRSCSKLLNSSPNKIYGNKVLKQAKLTNYLTVRKRRSLDSLGRKESPIKNRKLEAPRSPFRFVEEEHTTRTAKTGVLKSPQKVRVKKKSSKALHQVDSHEVPSRLSHLRAPVTRN